MESLAENPSPSPTRTRSTWKPRTTLSHYPFFICAECGHVYVNIDGTPTVQRVTIARELEKHHGDIAYLD